VAENCGWSVSQTGKYTIGFGDIMAETVKQQGIRRYAIVAVAMLVACIAAAGVTLVVRDRNEKEMLSQLERSQADLRTLGGQIANIKDADLTSANDFISAYAQIEPLEKEYEGKLQQFSGLYERARERDSHRGWLDLERCGDVITRNLGERCRRSLGWCGRSTKSQNANLRSARHGFAPRA